MRISLFFIVLVMCTVKVNAQDWTLNSAIGTSYSGINHNITAQRNFNHWHVSVGPSFNYGKNKLPWSATPGINVQTGYNLIDSGAIQTKAFVSYLLLPIQEATIQEVNLGYTMMFRLTPKLQATNSVGFGGYGETAEHYSINGFSYCINFGLSYRL